ncbi:S41 family peptidase [Sphingobacterium sp. E70]|uniref:S41 family peptidase n=1 Tax=Sphingobacterium sp. E70 TaxID=2853439 RepID=UPI00211B8588|nr:S41 family peptidase [Sphingobacterium sp. E70]ULT27651.1 S41 family peptidase [Sphingobacterium sp. E70]
MRNSFAGVSQLFQDEHIVLRSLTVARKKVSETMASPAEPEEEVIAKAINPEVFYIKIGSFAYENITPVKDLIVKHKEQIENSKGLIIDIRNNGGGTDDVYQPILPYVLTNPIRIMSVEFLPPIP